MKYYFIVIAGVLACSASQLLLKKSASQKHKNPIAEILNWRVIVAYGIMFVTLVTNIFAMNNGVMLKDMPILEATGYVFVPLLSLLVLGEKLNKKTMLAISLIIAGIIVFYL